MDRRIRLELGNFAITALLNDHPLADELWKALPLECCYATWGDEIYFDTGLEWSAEVGLVQTVVELGDVGYWPPGNALCLFYGPTPASRAGEIRPASPVAVLGRLEGDATRLKGVRAPTIRVVREGEPCGTYPIPVTG